jgi:hypothetical protein
MKTLKAISATRACLLSCMVLAAILLLVPSIMNLQTEWERAKLARSIGVNIEDYPYPALFPVPYFSKILMPGMSVAEVHQVVRGYKKVYRCREREVYYYFSNDDKRALRFEVLYDSNYRYEEVESEDDNSQTISIKDCSPWPLQE